jgi:hypothetical protein
MSCQRRSIAHIQDPQNAIPLSIRGTRPVPDYAQAKAGQVQDERSKDRSRTANSLNTLRAPKRKPRQNRTATDCSWHCRTACCKFRGLDKRET